MSVPDFKRGGKLVGSYVLREQKGGGGWWVTLDGEALRDPLPYIDAVEAADRMSASADPEAVPGERVDGKA